MIDVKLEDGTLSGSVGLPWLFALLMLLAALALTLSILRKGTLSFPPGLARLPRDLGLSGLPPFAFWTAAVLWTALVLTLTVGLFGLVLEVVFHGVVRSGDPDAWNFRFLLAQMVALTGVLGAVVALPFTLVRIGLARAQNATAEESLFNDKINAATENLYAQRQVTDGKRDVWQDDVIKRNAAIDRLEGLAEERPDTVSRIARMLSVYARELSRELPAQGLPSNANEEEIWHWTQRLSPVRSDLEKAVQTLGRSQSISSKSARNLLIDLRGANLQAFDLSALNFEKANFFEAQLQGVNFHDANLQGANLCGASLQGASLDLARLQRANLVSAALKSADLRVAQMQRIDLQDADLESADVRGAKLQGAFLRDTILHRADFLSANLNGTFILRAQFDRSTSFKAATLRGAAMREIDCTMTVFSQKQIDDAFGDASVSLGELTRPLHWDQGDEPPNWPEFVEKWHAYQRSIGMDPDNSA